MAQRKSPGPVEILVAGKSLNRTKSPGSGARYVELELGSVLASNTRTAKPITMVNLIIPMTYASDTIRWQS